MFVKRGFVERSLQDFLLFFQRSLFADEIAGRPGFLQAREPRLKLLTVFALLLCILFARDLAVIAGLYGLCLILAAVSSVPVIFFLKRTWLFIPLFSLAIVVPLLFTPRGVQSAALFFSRVLVSVSLCVLLSLTTKHFALLKALRGLGVSQVFVMTLGMCYRYIYLFFEVIRDTFIAVKSRVGRVASAGQGRHLVFGHVAGLWDRSYLLSEQVYQAMLSRGYCGEPKVMGGFRTTFKDSLCLAASIVLFIGVLWRS